MATYEVLHEEGMNFVKITLQDETVRAEAGALCYMIGKITMDARLPALGQFLRAKLAGESVVRPFYTGVGELYLESTYGGFYHLNLHNETWLLERGIYWASDNNVALSTQPLHPWLALRAGKSFWYFQTKVSGSGQVVLTAPGPVEEMTLDQGRLVVNGDYVIARSAGISFRLKRAARTVFGSWLAGEGQTRIYEGSGKLLISSIPYWRYAMAQKEAK